jgi:hypothetical protein
LKNGGAVFQIPNYSFSQLGKPKEINLGYNLWQMRADLPRAKLELNSEKPSTMQIAQSSMLRKDRLLWLNKES